MMLQISDTIKDSKINKSEREKEKGDTSTDGPSGGSSGAFGGTGNIDSTSNPNSGHANRDLSGEEVASEVARLLANIKLDNQLLQQPFMRGSNTSSHEDFERRRPSLPSNSPQRQQFGVLRHQISEPLLCQMNQNRKLNLNDPLATSVLNNLDLLEGLGNCLDKEYKGGKIKCWKHLCEYFEVEAKTYEDFTCSKEHSPTEDLFEFLKTTRSKEFTVGKLKDMLRSIERPDVQDVLLEYEDETQVGSLFESHPQVIAEMAFLLDKEEKPGKRNWKYLAVMFGVPQSESQNFGESIHENPSEKLFLYLCVKRPNLTTGEVKKHLRNLKMQDVLDVLAESKKVKDNSPLKDLWEDLEIAARVCNLLNKKHVSRMRCWRLLGNKLDVEKNTLDTFSNEGEMVSPTEVLIDHLGATKPRLVMADLIWALERIERTDVFSVVEGYFPDGDISRFLASARAQFGYTQQQIASSPYETSV